MRPYRTMPPKWGLEVIQSDVSPSITDAWPFGLFSMDHSIFTESSLLYSWTALSVSKINNRSRNFPIKSSEKVYKLEFLR